MTETITTSDSTTPDSNTPDSTPVAPPKRKRPWFRIVAVVLLLALLAATVVYALGQRSDNAALTKSLASSEKTIKATKAELVTVSDDLSSSQSEVTDLEAQLETCSTVSAVLDEFYWASTSLLDAVTDATEGSFDTTNIDAAGDNIDTATDLIADVGYEDDLQGLQDECTGSGGDGI